jgi:dolichol kinase
MEVMELIVIGELFYICHTVQSVIGTRWQLEPDGNRKSTNGSLFATIVNQ